MRASETWTLVGATVTALVVAGVAFALGAPTRTLAYNLPLLVPAALVAQDRLGEKRGPAQWLLDVGVLALAAMRWFLYPLPYASGHVLLCSYWALTSSSSWSRGSAAVLGVVVVGAKLSWGDAASPLLGMVLGGLLAALHTRFRASSGGV